MDKYLITADMKIFSIVKKHPELMDVLIEQSPKFKKLKNKLVFNTMAKVASVKEIAKVGGLEVDDLLLILNRSIGAEKSIQIMKSQDTAKQENNNTHNNDSQESKSLDYFKGLFNNNNYEVIDARAIDGDPFAKIMELADQIPAGYGFSLIQEFEPVPLYNILENKGFEHATEKNSEDEYRVYFLKRK